MYISGKAGQTTRKNLVDSLRNNITRVNPNAQGIQAFFQQEAIQSRSLNSIFGTPEEFLERYANFQRSYEEALKKDISITAGSKTNIDALKKSNTINLRILNHEAQKRLHEMFMYDVLRLPDLLREAGLPAYQMPSANKYGSIFKYALAPEGQIEHPVQIFLNRAIFNFNEDKTGLDSFKVAKSNILSHQTISRLFGEFQQSGSLGNIFGRAANQSLNILTLDVETTGVVSGSQVRSMSLLGMKSAPSGTVVGGINQNIAFKSQQMAGLTVSTMNNGIIDMYKHLADTEGTKLMDMGEGGKNFLDETEKFLRQILDPSVDRLAGHNIGFDLDMLRQTSAAQSLYGSHKGIQEAWQLLDERITKGNFLVDTLESTRSYLLEKVQNIVGQSGLIDLDERSKLFVNTLFSQETLASIHVGGSATYGSVENIALNTNLFELLENDGKADQLYKLINKGSHIAETDVYLQSYIADYVQTGRLDLLDRTTTMSPAARKARSRIFQSQAITATTNMADVRLLNDTVFSHITRNESIKKMGISARVTAQSLGLQTAEEGILKYDQGEKQFFFSTSTDRVAINNEAIATGEMQRILQSARTGVEDDALRIISTGITFQQGSNINELLSTRALISSAPITQQRSMENITNAFTTMYTNLGTGISTPDYIRAITGQDIVDSPFQTGLGQYSLTAAGEIARKFAKIGDPFASLPAQQRVYSTVLAESTAPIARKMQIIDMAGGTPIKLASAEIPDLLATLGLPVFEKQTGARIIDSGTRAASKVVVPTEILNQAIRDKFGENFTMRNVGRSVLEDGTFPRAMLNATWMVQRDLDKTQSEQLVENIFNIMKSEESAAEAMGVGKTQLDKTLKEQIALMQGLKGDDMKAAKESVVESIMKNDIVFANAGEQSEQAILQAKQAGEILDNDVLLNKQTMQYTVPSKGYQYTAVPLSPLMDRTELQIAGAIDEIDTASELVDFEVGINESGQVQTTKIPKYLEMKEKISSEILSDPSQARVLKGRLNRAKVGRDANVILDLFNQYKPKIGYAALGLAAAGAGYYMSKKHRERQLYNESMEAQPIERASQVNQYNSYSSEFNNNTSLRRDPLLTAGVVGNLDRAKIGHTRMGSDRYNHLYGGGY